LWKNFRITLLPREPSADELVEAIRAKAVLADMDFHEDLAELFETEPDALLRREFAERYRSLIGVYPTQRHIFREGLERVRELGGTPVASMIEALRRAYGAAIHSEK
jgi:hypothetical protein